jgi:hypothetical protein
MSTGKNLENERLIDDVVVINYSMFDIPFPDSIGFINWIHLFSC